MDDRNERDVVRHLIAGELDQPILESARAAAADIAAAHGDSVSAVLFYGSCLQQQTDEDKVLDFYVLADSLRSANGGAILGFFNQVLPPNVYYREMDYDGRKIRSKYAIVGTRQFADLVQADRMNLSFWARFAQPCAIAWARDRDARILATDAVTQAVITFVGAVLPTFRWHVPSATFWSNGFARTYGAELRAEDAPSRGREIYEKSQDRFDRLYAPAVNACGLAPRVSSDGQLRSIVTPWRRRRAKLAWFLRGLQGKLLSFLRLVKGAFTFAGAADYLAWKISRHSGVTIDVKPWHRRFPLIGGLVLFISTRLRGGFR